MALCGSFTAHASFWHFCCSWPPEYLSRPPRRPIGPFLKTLIQFLIVAVLQVMAPKFLKIFKVFDTIYFGKTYSRSDLILKSLATINPHYRNKHTIIKFNKNLLISLKLLDRNHFASHRHVKQSYHIFRCFFFNFT